MIINAGKEEIRMANEIISSMVQNMESSIQSLQKELVKMRTGRASTSLVDSIRVDYYGSGVPINQIPNVTTPDSRTVQISPWENQMISVIEKAILAANIGMTPQNDGKVIRIPIPPVTEERRKEMAKLIRKIGEEAKIAVRNHRREANDEIKRQEKEKNISEDIAKKMMEEIQKKTDQKITEIDKVIVNKENEIMKI